MPTVTKETGTSVSWLRSTQLENASAKGRDRPFDSSAKGLVWWAIDKDIN